MTEYHNDADQSERRDLLQEHLRQRQQGSTYSAHAHMHIDDAGGRFAKTRPSLTVGSKPTVDYPGDKLPAWVTDRGPDEPPLGFSVDAMEPVGESFEVLQSAMQANANVPTSEPAQQEPGAAIASPAHPLIR
jgi:hypothetical protein